MNVLCAQLNMELTDIGERGAGAAPLHYHDGKTVDRATMERMDNLWLLLEECSEILSSAGSAGSHQMHDTEGSEGDEQQLKWEQHYRDFLATQLSKIECGDGLSRHSAVRRGNDLFDALISHKADGFQENVERHSLAKAMEVTMRYANVELSAYERNVLSWCQANSEYGCGTPLDATSMVHWKQDEQWNMRFGGGHKFINYGYAHCVVFTV